MIQLFKMAFRDLGRNRRRTFFSMLAVGLGLTLLLLIAGFLNGEMGGAIDTAVRLQSGHLQVRANSYDEAKTSLKWQDLIENPDQIAAKISALAQVKAATPRLYASGFVSTGNESSGVKVIGIEPQSVANDPYKITSGSFLAADDREGLLIGQTLADKLALNAGDQVNLSVNTSNGDVVDQLFTIRGIFSTNTGAFDGFTVFLPLAKLQAMTQTENHASAIFVLLKDTSQTDAVVTALQTPAYQVLGWKKMNELFVQWETMANSYLSLIYLIVLAITASVIINTLIMSVYERTREIGILTAIGMKSRRILAMFLAETSMLAVGGVIMGLILGGLAVAYFTNYGFSIAKMGITGMLVSNTIYANLTFNDTITLSIVTFIVTILAGLYPAVMASRMEPVEALRAEK
jgi:ABC-type lipoprotein release transport system permease subunit